MNDYFADDSKLEDILATFALFTKQVKDAMRVSANVFDSYTGAGCHIENSSVAVRNSFAQG